METQPGQNLAEASQRRPSRDTHRKPEIIEEPPKPAKRQASYGLLLIWLLCCGTFIFGLGRLPFLGPDEPRYAEVAREMLVTGDYITPRLCGCLWFEKPVLLYWMSCAAYKTLGVGEFAARLPSALCALLTVGFLYHVLASRVSKTAAMACSAVLATSPLFIGYGRAAVTDMPLTATLSVALLSFYLSATATGRSRWRWWIVACASTGFAVLAKGLIGILLFGAIGIIALLLTRNRAFNNWLYWLLGACVLVTVCMVWYLPVIQRNGYPFVQEFIVNHHFKRYLTNQYHHPEPFYFYPAIAMGGIAPWVFYLIPAIARLWNWLKDPSRKWSPLYTLAVVWLLVPLIFFSFSESKLPGYILPVIPALALIAGMEIDRCWRGESGRALTTASYCVAVATTGLGIAFPIVLAKKSMSPSGVDAALVWIPGIIGLFTVLLVSFGRRRAFVAGVCASMVTLIIGAAIVALPGLGDQLGSKKLSLEAAAALRPGEEIAFYVDRDYAPVFYAEGRVACGGKAGDVLNALGTPELTEALESRQSLVVITPPPLLDWIKRNPKLRMDPQPIACERDECAVRVTLSDRPVSP